MRLLCLAIGFVWSVIASAESLPGHVDVFTTDSYTISNVDYVKKLGIHVTVYNLDAPFKISATLSRGLSTNSSDAVSQVSAMFSQMTPDQLNYMAAAWDGAVRAEMYDIRRVPAILFDHRAVVYGETDIEKALGDYQAWIKQ